MAVAMTGVLWRGSGPLELGPGLAVGVAASIALIFSLVNALLGVGRIVWSRANTNDAFLLGLSTILTTFVLLAVNQFWQPRDIPVIYLGYRLLAPGMIVVIGMVALVGFVTTRYRMRIITGLWTHWITLRGKTPVLGERVLIIGAGEAGQVAAYLLRHAEWGRAFSVVGMVDDAPRKQGVRLNGFQVLGRTSEIPELVDLHDVGLIVFAIERIKSLEKERILKIAANTPAQIVILPDVMATIRAQMTAAYQMSDGDQQMPDIAPGNGYNSNGSIAHSMVANSIMTQSASDLDYLTAASGLENWLVELEGLVQAEAWDAAHAKIQAMKQSLATSGE
jgi:FlaA1/EpsC-like NDP-sugar epimerase